jgi:glutamate racemase
MTNNSSIGIFDSGVGGLTVVKEIIKTLPNENLIYLGDTARVPYGTRDNETINKFSNELVRFMLKNRVKAIVVACNTISAVSLSSIVKIAGEIPVIDVICPTVEYVLNDKNINTIGIIGTRATINSKVYEA